MSETSPVHAPSSGDLRGQVHSYRLRVFFEDTDAAGIVYYANYLRFIERARTEMMRLLGIDHSELMAQDDIAFSVRRCEIEYLHPARLDDVIEVRSRVVEVRGASLWMSQIVVCNDREIARAAVRLAALRGGGGAGRLPERIRARLGDLMKQN